MNAYGIHIFLVLDADEEVNPLTNTDVQVDHGARNGIVRAVISSVSRVNSPAASTIILNCLVRGGNDVPAQVSCSGPKFCPACTSIRGVGAKILVTTSCKCISKN